MLNTGPHSCIWGGASNCLAPALDVTVREDCHSLLCHYVGIYVAAPDVTHHSWFATNTSACTTGDRGRSLQNDDDFFLKNSDEKSAYVD